MSSNDKYALELIRYYKKSWSLLQKFDDGSHFIFTEAIKAKILSLDMTRR